VQVILIAGSMFSDPYLGHHVCYILEGKHSIDRTSSALSSKASGTEKYIDKSGIEINQRPVSEELFDILLEAEQSGAPVKVTSHHVYASILNEWLRLCSSGRRI